VTVQPPQVAAALGSGTAAAPSDRVLTIPNGLSLARLLGIPLFMWLALGPKADGYAFGVLARAAVTDYLDGRIARQFNMASRLGALLDPVADRLYIAATLVVLVLRDIVPLWLVVVLVGRDVLLSGTLPILRRHGYGPLPVHFMGKAATFALLYALPLLLISHGAGSLTEGIRVLGWAFALWGTALYWWAGILYVSQVRQLVTAAKAEGGA
jgi:CDP-diacylglycerol--glycerol-3-phosphate 3-phosphatidyltransferase